MKKFKKLSALLLAVIMTLAMAVPAMAANAKHTVSVSNVTPGSVVTFYQIAQVNYNTDTDDILAIDEWTVAQQNSADITLPKNTDTNLESQIQALAQGLQAAATAANKITPVGNPQTATADANGIAKIEGERGQMYVAIVTAPAPEYGKNTAGKYVLLDGTETDEAPTDATKANYKKVIRTYNPALLSTPYYDDENGVAANNAINIDMKTQYQTPANASLKSSVPKVAKEITQTQGTQDGELDKDLYDEDEFTDRKENGGTWSGTGIDDEEGAKTVSIGDVINYEVQVDIPDYPANAVNKSLWITDTFDKGITFNGVTSIVVAGDKVPEATADANGYYAIKDGDNIIGWVKQTQAASDTTGGQFELIFNYDYVKTIATNGKISVAYTGTLNDKCEIGRNPNLNTVEYNYSTNPNKGGTYEPGKDKPTEDFATETDKEAVYSYEIALIKHDAEDETLRLKNAEFELYAGATATGTKLGAVLKDGVYYYCADATAAGYTTTFKSNDDGVVEVKGLEAGQYTFLETKAPDGGYTLASGTTVTITANWTEATYMNSSKSWTSKTSKASDKTWINTTKTEAQATAEEKEDDANWSATRDGYILNGKHITDADYEKLTAADKEKALPAYVVSNTQDFEHVTNPTPTNPAGISYEKLGNTKTPALPSTGGIGTYIFTIAGVAILAIAAFLLIFKRRKVEE